MTIMEKTKKYLQKVLIYVDETMIGVYRPIIDKNSCQLKTLDNFYKVDIRNVITNKNTKEHVLLKSNRLSKRPKCRKKKRHYVELEDVELTLLKNRIYDEYILFLTQESNSNLKHTVCLEMSNKLNKPPQNLKTNVVKLKDNKNVRKYLSKYRKSRKQPRNYKKLIGFEKMFEENIKNKLISCLKTYDANIAACAVFKTNNKNELKLFLTQEIKTEKDIYIFLKKLNYMNTSSKRIVNPDLSPQNVQAFIVLNQNKKDVYLELTDIIRQNLNKPLNNSQIIKYDNKKFINANLLNVKLHNLKFYTSFKELQRPRNIDKSDYSINSNTNSLISINEYSFNNIYGMIEQFEENVNSNFTSTTESCDNIIKDTYKLLVELQLNAIEQCNQLYLNYFNTNCCSKERQMKFTDSVKNNYGLLLRLQNKAIENSVFVNKKIKNVNKFINKLTDKSKSIRQCCSTSHLRQKTRFSNFKKVSSTSLVKYPRKLTSISDYKLVSRKMSNQEVKVQVINNFDNSNSKTYLSSDVSACTSTITLVQKAFGETEVQTSLKDIQQVVEDVIKINKCCSPINLTEMQDKKCVQTDISVNKHTSIDFGGQSVQICKRNISLKMRRKAIEPKPPIKEKLEEEIAKNVEDTRRTVIEQKPPIKEKLEEEIAKNVEDTKKLLKEILISPSEKEILSHLDNPKVQRKCDKEETLTTKEELKKTDETNLKFDENLTEENLKTLVEIPNEPLDSLEPKIEAIASTNVEDDLKDEDFDELGSFPSDLEAKLDKLSIILQKIQEESKLKIEDIPFSSSSKKLCTIPEEPKEEIKVEPRKHEFLFNIKNTLERVKERFEKNTLILKKVTDLKDNYMISTNMQKLIETSGLRQGEFPGKPKFIKMPVTDLKSLSSTATINSVQQTKLEIARNLSSSLQLLKNLNEVTKNIKNSPDTAMIKLSEIEDSIQFQRKLTPKYRCEKSHLTLTPIKNFIASNKMKVSNNATRLAKYEAKSKKSRIMPSINSKHIIDLSRQKNKKNRRAKCVKVSSTFIKIPKPVVHPTVQTTNEIPLIPKIYRPVTPKHFHLDNSKLSNLTLTDVAPFQPEYPRKDNLSHIEIEKTYLYKLLNNSFSEKSLEPLIKCSNANCTSCTTMPSKRMVDRSPKKRHEYFSKNKKTDESTSKTCFWEKMHWNTEITVQPDHDFDFKQYMDDPDLLKAEVKPQNVTVCPVTVTVDKSIPEVGKSSPQSSFEQHLKSLQHAVTINKKVTVNKAVANQQGNSRTTTTIAKNTLAAKANQNKIQKSIQQAILKNQEKFKFIEQSLLPKQTQNPIKFKKNVPSKTPKIISSGTLNTKKVLWQKLGPQFSKRNETFLRRHQNAMATKDDNIFDRKYKENSLSIPPSAANINMDDGILHQISQTVKKSQDDMQKYIELVEQKFLSTFSMPETEKASAYTNLESEIKEMLHLLNTSKDNKRELNAKTEARVEKPEVPVEKTESKAQKIAKPRPKPSSRPTSAKIVQKVSVEKPKVIKTTSEKTRPSKSTNKSHISQQKLKKVHQEPKILLKESDSSVIMIKEPNKNNFISGSEVAMEEATKKKACEKPGPTICTDPISFLESFTAIVAKQNFMFPSFQKPEFKKSTSILKSTSNNPKTSASDNCNLKTIASDKSVNKKVRFKLDDIKVTKSDSSVTMSTDEEYSTLCEETASEFSSSDQEITQIIRINMDFSLLLNLQNTFFVEYPYSTPEIYYIITTYEQVTIDFMPENYDVKIICSKEFDTFDLVTSSVSNSESHLEPTEIVYKSDSLSDFIENCEEIIEATKNLELDRKKSSDILQFLDLITSISVENLGLKKDLYFQITRFNSYPQHFPLTYCICNIFQQIFYKNSDNSIVITNKYEQETDELGTLIPKNTSKFIIPFENIDALIKQSAQSSKIVPYQNMQLQKHFSEPEFSSELLKYHIKIPFSEELVKSHSDTKCLDVLTYNTRHSYETICQTLVLNLQVQNCGHRKPSLSKNARKTIRKKYYLAPSKNKLQLKAIEVGFGFDKNKFLMVEAAHKRFLICLYILVFSFAFLSMTLNYKCE